MTIHEHKQATQKATKSSFWSYSRNGGRSDGECHRPTRCHRSHHQGEFCHALVSAGKDGLMRMDDAASAGSDQYLLHKLTKFFEYSSMVNIHERIRDTVASCGS